MLTLNKSRLASLTTLTGLSIFSAGMSLAETDPSVFSDEDTGNYRSEERTEPMSCSDALQLAWFKRQIELSDGDTSPDPSLVQTPRECERDIVAEAKDIG